MTWSVEGLTVRFGDRTALAAVDMRITAGQVHAVVGGDGAGKSTLLRVLTGRIAAGEGRVHLPPRERIGSVPTHGGVFDDLSVDENLEFVAQAHRLRGWQDRADSLLTSTALAPFGARLARRLSGGQRRKLAAAMAMLPRPDLLVFDEVTTGVDPVSRMELWRMVATAVAAGTAVVAATTYLDEAERAGSVLLLDRGRVLASGDPRDIDADRGVDTLEDAAIVHELAAREAFR